MKGLENMNDNQEQKKELKKLPGFYIALCCCVLAIGLAGYFTERHENNKTTDLNSEFDENNSVFSGDIDSFTEAAINRNAVPASETITHEEYDAEVQTANADVVVEENTSSELPDEEEVVNYNDTPAEYTVDNPDVSETAVIVSADEMSFEMPVSGDTLEGFSEKLVYNSSMSDWRTHDGIDLAADIGCSVHAAADGTVKSVFSNASGECIELEHADGFSTRYIGLQSIENLNEGDVVSSGDVIGLIGASKGENVTEPHLHLEVYKDGIAVDPTKYLN
jgi:murein DD-endopeptidase MepM/ murein hydrolase activator NlpD